MIHLERQDLDCYSLDSEFPHGGVAEWLKAPVLKTGRANYPRGFESHPLRWTPAARRSAWRRVSQRNPMNRIVENGLSKVPEVTLAFWVIKIAATTLGETAGDAV